MRRGEERGGKKWRGRESKEGAGGRGGEGRKERRRRMITESRGECRSNWQVYLAVCIS